MCRGTTLKGEPCKQPTEPYCRHHVPPAKTVTLPYPIDGTVCKRAKQKIITKVKNGPTKSDGYGHIYIYYLDSDPKNSYYKIGMTERPVDTRLKEWKGSKLKKSFRVANRKHAERLMHLYLDGHRVYRYKQDDGTFSTVWKDSGLPVTLQDEKGERKGRAKQVEWFFCPWKTVEKVANAILK